MSRSVLDVLLSELGWDYDESEGEIPMRKSVGFFCAVTAVAMACGCQTTSPSGDGGVDASGDGASTGCKTNADCPGYSGPGPGVCDTTNGSCYVCVTNADCATNPSGAWCNNATNGGNGTCGCSTSADCPAWRGACNTLWHLCPPKCT